MPKISIEKEFLEFADVALRGIPKESTQYKESKKVFYAAAGQILIAIRDVLGDDSLPELEGVRALQDMLEQCSNFFKKEGEEYEQRRFKK